MKKVSNEDLKQQFFNTRSFGNFDINKFILMLQGVYPQEYMHDWQKFETLLLK